MLAESEKERGQDKEFMYSQRRRRGHRGSALSGSLCGDAGFLDFESETG